MLQQVRYFPELFGCTVEPILKDHPIGHTNVVSLHSLVTGSITLKCSIFLQEYLVFQDRWPLMVVVSQDRFHCTRIFLSFFPSRTICFTTTVMAVLATL